jgi:LPPG:FO 2-phospho-L-lactate transferase
MSYTILSGGVGGAKLVAGFDALLSPSELRVIANTADDFVHLGLNISPDIDTLMYTLADIANPATGWGIVNETFESMAALDRLGGETWFQLGDKDLATHLQRTTLLQQGKSLSEVTALLCISLGITTRIIPMTNDSVATRVHTNEGVLAFQDYFVRRKAEPAVSRLVYAGADTANISSAARDALSRDSLKAIVITPSNPYLSIDPILAIKGIRDALRETSAPVVAISPIVGGRALKGPTAKIMNELGLESSALAIAKHYHGIIDGLIIDPADSALASDIEALGIKVCITDTVMSDLTSKKVLAAAVTDFVATFANEAE